MTEDEESWSIQVQNEEDAQVAFKTSSSITRTPPQKRTAALNNIYASPTKNSTKPRMKQQQQQETKGPSPIPNSAEMTNIDDILDNATKAMETLQQKALAADKKVEIANLIKAMAETIVTLKTRDHQPNEHSHYECHEAFQSIKQELAEIRASMSSNLKTYAQRAAAAPPFHNAAKYTP